MKRGAPLKRSELRRSSSLPRGGGLQRTAMRVGRSRGARRQDALRRSAYSVVDERSGGRCEMVSYYVRCVHPAEHHHHRRPRRMGGSTDGATETASNLLHLCPDHHQWLESRRDSAYTMGLLVRAGHDPATTPVLLHVGWVLLNDEGTYTPTKETL